MPHGSYILTNGLKVKYEAAESEKLSTERIFEMLDDEEITRDQAIRMLNVDKTEATNILGGDIVADITYTEVGKKADIRIEKLPIEQLDEEAVVAAQKRSRVRRRKIGRKQQQESTPARPKRRVKVRNND